jgi:hypothetical protein
MTLQLKSTISVCIMGDKSYPIIKKNSELPTNNKIVCPAYVDNRGNIEVIVLYGENAHALDNLCLTRILLWGIPKPKKGDLKIEIMVSIDSNEMLVASATDLSSGTHEKSVSISLSNVEPPPLKYRNLIENPTPELVDFTEFAHAFYPFAHLNDEYSKSDDMGKLIYWLSRDLEFRNTFFTDRYNVIREFHLNNNQLLALRILTPSVFEMADASTIIKAVSA